MKTRTLATDKLGHKEDWEGNNIALECPACGKVHLVSAQIHKGERVVAGFGMALA